MSATVLVTGATGFLGTWIARRLLAEPGVTVIALVRARDGPGATRRLGRAWWDWPELAGAVGSRVEVVRGDVTQPRLGLDDATYDALVRRLTHVIHAAGAVRLDTPADELQRTNVDGTRHVLELARAAHRDHGLDRFAHLSTAYVCGNRTGDVPEDALTDGYGFANAYERTKFEGESLGRAAADELPVSIVRPSMVVGDSRTGEITTFNTIYYPLRLYLTGKLPVLPVHAGARLDLIPVDVVADAVVRLAFDPRAAGLTFHLTAPPASSPTAGELTAFVRAWAGDQLGIHLRRPLFVPALGGVSARLPGIGASSLPALLPYLRERRFQRDNTDRVLGPYETDWRELMPRLLAYAVAKGFMHRSGRTVHEQILDRLARPSRPITYRDIVQGTAIPRSAAAVRDDALAAAAALRSRGIRPGDRVAVVGRNSSRSLAIDVAIGLAGAVSVPLYDTSPPAEIDAILRASGARLLFVGAPAVLGRLGELTAELPVVNFWREPAPAGSRPVIEWEAFLAVGSGAAREPAAPVGFNDPATIRCTSGTTGCPKGVVFTHGQLRWMAETMAGLLPWEARTTRATYLSFLPMSHVVEGILATYAPYFIPAPVDVWFLEDFRDLQRALPSVRPTIFFAVPRVYERVWDALRASRLGRRYLASPPGLVRAGLRPLIRRALLRRAGLDRCAQLIVGSAPCDEALLQDFRELGIELHNAYGLTEAPLVTLNRSGANRIGTVGTPLPETELRIAEDGEVLVRGPQVTAAYLDSEAGSPLRDGWLATGDLGELAADGYLTVRGRKKELIATSYGKKISPEKIETMLREIPGVAEAMVVGEKRPYCAAILWASRETDADEPAAIDRGVAAVNARLSHPEQLKRWAILPNDLSIERGDLTANLKLRRQAVLPRLQPAIDALYADRAPAPALHVGRIERAARVPA